MTFFESLPSIKPERVSKGDHFVSMSFYEKSMETYIATAVMKTGIRFKNVRDGVGSFWRFSRNAKTMWRKVTPDTLDVIRKLEQRKEDARSFLAKKHRRHRDLYVLWNEITDGDVDDNKHGLLVEAFDGNGRLTYRVRMLHDGASEFPLFLEFEPIVEQIGKQLRDQDPEEERVFQIHHVPELD